MAEFEELDGFEPEVEETPDQPVEASPPRKYAGKYDSVEDMEAAHLEQDKMIGKQSKIVGQLRAAGYEVDDDGNIIPPNNYQPNPTTDAPEDAPPANDFWEKPEENIKNLVGTMLTRAQQEMKQANANARYLLNQRKSDPAFKIVGADFEAALAQVPDEVMANGQQAQQHAEYIYNSLLGNKLRGVIANGAELTGRGIMDALGVSSPEAGGETGKESVSHGDRAVLGAMGLTGKDVKDVEERFTSRKDR